MATAFSLALIFFLVANPVGNSPAIMALIKDYDFERQKKIMLREAFISFLIALFFQFFGEYFLATLKISDYALSCTGGIVLFILALRMIFHAPETTTETTKKSEPFIVPIAMPIISGPGLMTIIMVKTRIVPDFWLVTLGIIIAWIGVTLVLGFAPYLQKLLGKRGMDAMEQVMGMILALIAVNMIVNGGLLFVKTL
jgi:MarC family membrane protein